jgi:hypothetical protein
MTDADADGDAGEGGEAGGADADAPADDGDGGERAATDDAPADDAAGSVGLAEARRRALDLADEVLEYDVDRVIRVEPADDGWRVLVEVVEREAVPDTNDILGRYELIIGRTGDLTEFGLLERYKRGELREEL